MKCVLISDTDSELVERLAQALARCGSFIDVLTAGSGSEVLEILNRTWVDLVISGLGGPSPDGYELLAVMSKRHHRTRVIVMADRNTPILRARIRALGVRESFQKPVDPEEVAERVFAELQIRARGEVWGIDLAAFLQMLSAESKTCSLKVTKGRLQGRLFMEQGELIAAEHANLHGNEAARAVLSWSDTLIEIDYRPYRRNREIAGSLMNLLMQGQKFKDEDRMDREQMRRHERVNCLVAVDFNLHNCSHSRLIRNISEGGAFIESDEPVAVGDRLEMKLSSVKSGNETVIRGTVVRRGEHGFGVQFDDLNDQQRAFLSELLTP